MRGDITVTTPCDVLRSDCLLDVIEPVRRQDVRRTIVFFDGGVESLTVNGQSMMSLVLMAIQQSRDVKM